MELADIMRTPHPWQPPVIEWIKPRERAACCLDMRLGKCHIFAQWLAARNVNICLVIAPISAHADFAESLTADGFNPVILEGSREERCQQLTELITQGKPTVFITNAEALYTSLLLTNGKRRPVPTEIALFNWPAVCWDEFIVLANPQNQATKVAQQYLSRARCKLILSGEYAPESPLQVFEPMRFLFGSFMGDRNFWTWRANNFYQDGFAWTPKDVHAIRRAFSEHAYILSRKAAGVEENKAPDETRYCELPESIRQDYQKIAGNLLVDLGDKMLCAPCKGKGWMWREGIEEMCGQCFGEGKLSARQTNLIMVTMNWLSQLAGGYPKDFPALHSTHKSELLREVVDQYAFEPLIVTFKYNSELYACDQILRERDKVRTGVLVGATPKQHRTAIIRSWERGTGPRVLLAQAKVVSYGMNLAHADTMIRYSLPYSYNIISQNRSRIVSTTKKSLLLYINLCCKDTIDVEALESANLKGPAARLFMRQFKERVIKGIRMAV